VVERVNREEQHLVEGFPSATWDNIDARFIGGSTESPSALHVITVLVFVFHDLQFLLANIRNRGWSIPGGRIEPDESCEAAAKREAYEETGARISQLQKIGFYLLTDNSSDPKQTRLVPVYIASADCLLPLPVGFESLGVMHTTLSQLPKVYYLWDPLIEAVCSYAHTRALDLGWCS
jgi:8-oxo-dGTP diphosphatase